MWPMRTFLKKLRERLWFPTSEATGCIAPFSSLKMFPNFASHTRAAFSSMVWNTGSNSGRRANDAQHLGGRGLLLQQFA